MKDKTMKADGDADRLKQDFCKQVDEAKEQCSFEAFQRSQAFYAPLGGALVALSFALLHFGALVPFNFGSDGQALGQILDGLVKLLSKELIETDYAQTHVFAMLLFVIVLCCGLYFLHYADKQKRAFREVHPFLPGKADKSELAKAGKAGRHMMVVAVIFVASGIILYISSQYFSRSQGFHGVSSIFNGNASPLCNILDGFSFSFFSVATWLIMRSIRIAKAPSYLTYNLEVLTELSPYQVCEDHLSPNHDIRLVAKGILDKAITRGRIFLGICAVITFAMFVLPSIEMPIWWVPLIMGLIGRDLFVAQGVKRCKQELAPLL